MTLNEPAQTTVAPARRGPRPDGRKQRWSAHKTARRMELTDGAMSAVRALGAEAGMDEIAAHVGVSKTVLYRFFTDKHDLTNAVAARFMETVLIPRLSDALENDVDEYELTRTVITEYVHAVRDDANLYRHVLSTHPATGPAGDYDRVVAALLISAVSLGVTEYQVDTRGMEVWSYAFLGSIHRTVDWWIDDRPVSTEELIDYLTMLLWSGIVGITTCRGSREAFAADPPRPPRPPRPAAEGDDEQP